MHLRHISWNLAGLGVPLITAAIAVPPLLDNIGPERFGLLSLAWALIGAAGVFDLGIGRATTQRIASLRGGNSENQVPDVLATAVRLTVLAGASGMVLIALATLFRVYALIETESVSSREMQFSMLLLAIALPIQAVSMTYRGVNEAYLNFKNISLIRVALGAANFGAPFLVSLYTLQVHWLVGTLVLSRVIGMWLYRKFAYKCLYRASYCKKGAYKAVVAKDLFYFGGWVTVSAFLGLFLSQSDRFLVGVLVSASAVTLYAIPHGLVMQVLVIAGAVTSVAFPEISRLLQVDSKEAYILFRYWFFRLGLLMMIVTVLLFYFLPSILYLWLGDQADQVSITIGRILCIGAFFNALGSMLYSLLHAHGESAITAKIHLVETPLFVAALYFSVVSYGAVGAAYAVTFRLVIDAYILFLFSNKKEGVVG